MERKEFNELSFYDKLEYIWEYYKGYIVAGVIILVFVISMILNYVGNARTENVLDIAFLTDSYDGYNSDLAEALQMDLETYMYDDTNKKNQIVSVENIDIAFDGSYDTAMVYEATFSAKASAHEYDVFVTDIDNYNLLLEYDYLIPLNALIEDGDLEIDESMYVYGQGFSDAEEFLYGIDAKASEIINSTVFESEGMIICLCNDETNIENTIKAFNYLLTNN